jgi:EPS-associated MarR family transcriptional regulator
MGIALGKVNYIVKALIEKGFVKMGNFVNEDDKKRYRYLLTPEGIENKINATKKFVAIKKEEYEMLQRELDEHERGSN